MSDVGRPGDSATRHSWRWLRRLQRDRGGATAVEFAVLAPVLLLMLFGTLEIARFLFAQNTVEAATATALRQAIVDPTMGTEALRERFVDALAGLDDGLIESFTVERTPEPGTTLQRVTVSVSFTFAPVVPMIFNDPWRIQSTARGAADT
jgi:Flp pilus assembly protein TadG